MSKIGDIAQRLGSLPPREDTVMEFGADDGATTKSVWKDAVNVRYKKDGIRQDIVGRGGSEVAYSTADTYGNIITLETFTSSFEGVTYQYQLRHLATRLILRNLTTETETVYAADVGFSATVKIQTVVVGRFLYLFDTGGGQAWYIDLKTKTIYSWYSAKPARLEGSAWITTGSYKEKNIWGIEEGKSIYVYEDSKTASHSLSNLVLDRGVHRYEFKGGKFIKIGSQEYKFDTWIILNSPTTFTLEGSGTDPLLYDNDVPLLNGRIDWTPQLTNVHTVKADGTLLFRSPWDNETAKDVVIDSGYPKAVPNGIDLSAIGKSLGPNILQEATYIPNPNFVHPTLYRSYCIAYELNDGSMTYASAPREVSILSTNLITVTTEFKITKRGVSLTHFTGSAPGANVPTNAVKGYLFATRWQLSDRDCYAPRPEYPNSAYFLAQTFNVTDATIEDFTPDSSLIDGMTSYVPHIDGKPSFLPPNSIKPHHVSGVKGSAIIGGYTLQRPVPLLNTTVFLDQTGSVYAGLHFYIIYEYSDGTFSRAVKFVMKDTTNVFIQPPLPALVSAVYLYLQEEVDEATYYLVKKITDVDAEFYGMELDISTTVGDYPVTSLPTGLDKKNESLKLNNYFALATPMQMVDIASQQALKNVEEVRRVYADFIDSQRPDALRYLVYVLTNKRPVMAYMNAQISGEGFVFDLNDEPVAEDLPLLNSASSTLWGDAVVYQSYDGLYIWKGSTIKRLIESSRYAVLANPLLDAVSYSKESELWLLGANNTVLVLGGKHSIDSDNPVTPVLMTYHANDVLTMRALSALGNVLYGAFNHKVIKLDRSNLIVDKDISANELAITGSLVSDYFGGVFEQLYLDVIELVGVGLTVQVSVDLQSARFDDGGAWTSSFWTDIATTDEALSMKGTLFGLYGRGVQPRIRLRLKVTGANRLAAVKLNYVALKHENAARF